MAANIILLVNSDTTERSTLQLALQLRGYSVLAAGNSSTIEPYVRSCYAFVDLNTTVLIPRSLSQCNLLGVGDAGGCLRLPENEATGLAPRDRNASASDLSQRDAREASPPEPCGVPSSDAC
jgi:hypothetical protein